MAAPVVVFLGPSLPQPMAQAILDGIYLPPASRGSIIEAVKQHRPAALVLIDGVFETAPAVRHSEILWALRRGIPVIGAASMGALRAAELWRQGMRGVGLIYRWYRRYHLAPDDAVAVLHAPPDLGSTPLTRSRIDLRMTLRSAARRGLLDHGLRLKLEAALRAMNFRDLTLEALVIRALDTADPDLIAKIESAFISQKRLDACQALQAAAGIPQSRRA
jgi:hypothetical protein